jgi:hypothetical protein
VETTIRSGPLTCAFALIFAICPSTSRLFAGEPRFDVNDISYLWPVAATKDDVAALLSADELTLDGESQIWPKDAFQAVVSSAPLVTVANSAGGANNIDYRPFEADFARPSTWKVIAFRVDPSAPGCDPQLIGFFGSVPQLRLIVQPVTVNESGTVKVHDFTAHLVFSFVTGTNEPAAPTGPRRFIPDKDKFRDIVSDLKSLKAAAETGLAPTAGRLGVHPALKAKVPGFADRVKAFLKKHATTSRLSAVAFMGVQTPEPWIFFAMTRKPDGKFARVPHPALGGKDAQMLILRGGTPVMPAPTTTNMVGEKGVSTAMLFEGDVPGRLATAAVTGLARPLYQDIPDIIANPRLAHFFSTDCISCHSESSRRKELNIPLGDAMFRFVPADGISGVDETVLPQSIWNVRNFGWFPRGAAVVASVTMRTANEAAETVEFVNREYLGHAP